MGANIKHTRYFNQTSYFRSIHSTCTARLYGHMFDMVELSLVIEEHWPSANWNFKNLPRYKKEFVCKLKCTNCVFTWQNSLLHSDLTVLVFTCLLNRQADIKLLWYYQCCCYSSSIFCILCMVLYHSAIMHHIHGII